MRSLNRTFLGITLAFFCTGCKVAENFLEAASRSETLSVAEDVRGITSTSSYAIKALNGTPPYAYSLISGPGAIDGAGIYTADGTTGTAVIKVTDAVGQSSMKSLQIVNPLTLSPAPGSIGAFANVTFTPSGGSGSGYSITMDSTLSSLWNSLTNFLTRPWKSGSFSVSVTDSLGFSQGFNYTLRAGSIAFPGNNPNWSYLQKPKFDSLGNQYYLGRFGGTFNGHSPAGGVGISLLKVNFSGQILWSTAYAETASCGIAWADMVLKGNFIYLPLDCFGPGVFEGITISARTHFIKKIKTSDGTVVWTHKVPAVLRRIAIDADDDDNVYVAGTSTQSVYGSAVPGSQDSFLAKLDSNANPIWVRYAGYLTGYSAGLTLQSDGSIHFFGSSDGQTLPGSTNPTGLRQPFVIKFLADGTRTWSAQVPLTQAWIDWAFTSDLSTAFRTENIGGLNGKVVFCGGLWLWPADYATSPYIAIYSNTGVRTFFKEYLPNTAQIGNTAKCTLTNDAIYLSFSSDTPYSSLGNSGSDLVVVKVDFDGNEIWTKKFETHIPFSLYTSSSTNIPFNGGVLYLFNPISDFNGNGSSELDIYRIAVASDGTATTGALGFNFPSSGWADANLSLNPVDGHLYGAVNGWEVPVDGVSAGDWGGVFIMKFNSLFERQ